MTKLDNIRKKLMSNLNLHQTQLFIEYLTEMRKEIFKL